MKSHITRHGLDLFTRRTPPLPFFDVEQVVSTDNFELSAGMVVVNSSGRITHANAAGRASQAG